MGAWGSGPFENDDAADWAWELTPEADERVVAAALARGAHGVSSDAVVVAAAEVVAAGMGRPHPELPDEVAAWVDERRDRPWADLLPAALAAAQQVRGDSELAELWRESQDDAWSREVDDLVGRFRAAT